MRELIGFLPGNNADEPPARATTDPDDRRDEALLDIIPESASQPYDMLDVIRRVVDEGHFFEVQRGYGDNIVVGFAPLKPAEFVIIKIQQMAGQIQA